MILWMRRHRPSIAVAMTPNAFRLALEVLYQRLPQSLPFLHELHVMVEVPGVGLYEVFQRDFAGFVVQAGAAEGLVRLPAEDLAHQAPILRKDIAGCCGIEFVVRQTLREERFVVADQRWAILGDHPLHAVGGDQIAVHHVHHNLLNAPRARHRKGIELGGVSPRMAS